MLADSLTLPTDTTRLALSSEALARIESYRGGAADLHELLPSVLPLARPRWYETAVTAKRGTVMTLGYLAEPHEEGIAVSFAAAGNGRLFMWLGPVVVTATGMERPAGMPDAHWRELRSATGFAIRALLLGM